MSENCKSVCQNKTSMQMVEEFHKTFSHPIGIKPYMTPKDIMVLLWFRLDLIEEEFNELNEEGAVGKITPNFIKEIADLQYVLDGLCVTFGIDKDEAVRRVHESNMSKLGEDGKPILRGDGKVLKGPNYKEPDMTDLVP